MQLFYTPRSHFSRKVRILLAGLGEQVELFDIGNVAECNAPLFGPNPLMKVPTLVDEKRFVLDSDHIAQYIVRKVDPQDRFRVFVDDFDILNVRAVMNGIMATEVELILAERTGIHTKGLRRFDKMREALRTSLQWLDRHAAVFPNEPTYLGFHLVAMWDHLMLYGMCELDLPHLRECAARGNELPYVAQSKPI